MKIRQIATLHSAARQLRKKFVPKAVILLYHRVVELSSSSSSSSSSDPQLLGVTSQHFAQHLEVLRRSYHPMGLQQFVQAQRNGNLPQRAVVVTFDDGYADNLHNAKPLLSRYDIPATVFVTTGYIGQTREFWWDELDRLLLQPSTLPETLRLSVNGNSYHWHLGEASHYSEEAFGRHRGWNVLQKETPGSRQHLYRSLCQLLHPLSEGEQQRVLALLRAWAGVEPTGRLTHRALSAEDVFQLEEGGMVEVGAHTVSHPLLSTCSVNVQRAEIQGSKAHLEEILGHPVSSFSYPYGYRSAYTAQTVTIVREAGFACACSNFVGHPKGFLGLEGFLPLWQRSDCFQLPRFLVRDWDGDELARRLEEGFRA